MHNSMRISRIKTKILLFASACLLGSGCEPEPVQTRFLTPEESGTVAWADLTLTLSAGQGSGGTKASLLKDVEQKGSGALVLVFRTETQQLDSYRFFTQEEIRDQDRVPLKLRVPLAHCDFYILGNLNAVHKTQQSRFVNLMEALGDSFPVNEAALESLVYWLDGGDLNGDWRRERFEEVAVCGIPYMHVKKNVDTAGQIAQGQGIPGSDQCRRLFSKVTVRIDHAAFDGGGADPGIFVNSRLYLRQANARLQPFSETPQKAGAPEDILPQSDYDSEMAPSNASVTTFSFYVPENMQGTLLPGNTDSRKKTPDELTRQGLEARAAFLTYVEFQGHLDRGAGGYGGDVTYRFYLGENNCSNFDLARGREYEISLTFRVGSLFEPDWKVEPVNWDDSRLFCLTGDPGFADRLPEGRILAVRANRPGALYVYMNPGGVLGARNALLGRDALTGPSFVPQSLADCAWYGSFLTPGSADSAWLAERGIVPTWNPANGRLDFTVTDRSRLAGHVGESRTLTLTLFPNGTSTAFTLRLLPDIMVSVADGLSLTDEFYLGQKRTVTVSGFVEGDDIRYAADQDGCGRTTGAAHTQNVQWKSSPDASAAFPSCAVDAGGHVVLSVSDPAYASQRCSGSLDIYAFYPNRFQPSHSGWTSRNGKVIFFSKDLLNDTVEVPLRISEPRLHTGVSEVHLPIDGNEVYTDFGYWTFDDSARLPASSFDVFLLQTRLGVVLRSISGASYNAWASCFAMDPATGLIYVKATTSSEGNLEDRTYGHTNGSYNTGLGRWQLYPEVLTDLYGNSPGFDIRVTKLILHNVKNGLWTQKEGNSVGVSGIPIMSGYYATNSIGGEQQLTDNTTFSVSADYFFFHGDLSRIEWRRDGDATSYTCYQTPNETVYPVIDYLVETDDTGSGGTFSWVYDESHQVMRSSSGEPVPGGLIVPFGRQYITATYKNKWDGRTFRVQADFNLTYPVFNASILVVARPGAVNASVYLMPQKIIKYLKLMGPDVNTNARHWMMMLFNRSDWMNSVQFNNCYQSQSGSNYYRSPGITMVNPRKDYDIKYLWYYLYGNDNVSAWTKEAIDLLCIPSGRRPMASTVAQSAMIQGYNSDYFTTLSNSASYVQGIWWTKPEDF